MNAGTRRRIAMAAALVLMALSASSRTHRRPPLLRGGVRAWVPAGSDPRKDLSTIDPSFASAHAKPDLSKVTGLLVRNEGQMDERVRFALKDRSVSVFFTDTGFTFSAIRGSQGLAIQSEFVGGRAVEPEAVGRREAEVSYFVGDPSQWRSGLPTYEKLVYRDVWPQVDVVYEPRASAFEYTVVVRPGGSVEDVRFAYRGVDGLSLDDAGNLILESEMGAMTESKPVTRQDGEEIASAFQVHGDGSYGFDVPQYDRSRSVVIDPTLAYGTYLGLIPSGPDDAILGMAIDSSGNVYLTGETSSEFPTTSGAFDRTRSDKDAFVTKLNSGGSGLVWSTFLGGGGDDVGRAIAIDGLRNVYVTGRAGSGFPVTTGAFGTVYAGYDDSFVAKITASGRSLTWATYLGGSGFETANAIAVDPTGEVYVAGETASSDFPVTAGSWDTLFGWGYYDAFVTKINSTGTGLAWSTFLGGSSDDYANGIAIDPTLFNVYVVGLTGGGDFPTTPTAFDATHNGNGDVFVTQLRTDGTGLVWSTFLGGYRYDSGTAIAQDAAGNIYVTGLTYGSYPTTTGAFDTSTNGGGDVFVAKLHADGTALWWSTLLGGGDYEVGKAICVDLAGDVYVTGFTSSATTFPTTAGAYDTTLNGGEDAFVTKIRADGAALVWSTLLGSSLDDAGVAIARDSAGNVYVAGTTEGADFPTTSSAYDRSHNGGSDTFVTKLNSLGSRLVWSTCLGGGSNDGANAIAVDSSGNMYVAGSSSSFFPTTTGAYDTSHDFKSDVFVTKLDSAGATIAWSTYLGHSGDEAAWSVVVDDSGNVFVTGSTSSASFPQTIGSTFTGTTDAFVTKIDAGGATLGWSRSLGGASTDIGYAIALDPSGNVYVTGSTSSSGFPTTAAYDATLNGTSDAFATKLDTTGAIVWSTFLGGTSKDEGKALAVDEAGNVYLTGVTYSTGFPASGYDTTYAGGGDVFVFKLAADGATREWATFLGGASKDEGKALAVDSIGNVYVTGTTSSSLFPTTEGAFDRTYNGGGSDVFVTMINEIGTDLAWSTFLGGSSADSGSAIAVDASDNVYVTGSTRSRTFPTTADAYDRTHNGKSDAFLASFHAADGTRGWSTFLGGTQDDAGNAVAVDEWGDIYVAGVTASGAFPTTSGAVDTTYNGGTDAFVVRITPFDP